MIASVIDEPIKNLDIMYLRQATTKRIHVHTSWDTLQWLTMHLLWYFIDAFMVPCGKCIENLRPWSWDTRISLISILFVFPEYVKDY